MKLYHYADFPLTPRPHSRYPVSKFPSLVSAAQRLPFPVTVEVPQPVDEKTLKLAHTERYVRAVKDSALTERESRTLGFESDELLYPRGIHIAGAALRTVDTALCEGISFTLGGGAHHGHADEGRGFCIFNDTALSSLWALRTGRASKVSILDCDVHQGDGTARILAHEPRIQTLSIHGERNYPFRKAKSDVDIPLPDDVSDKKYLEAVEHMINQVRSFSPELLIYIAGADPYKEDTLGRLSLSRECLAERDRMVFTFSYFSELPIAVFFGGGYCKPISLTVSLNIHTISVAHRVFFPLHTHNT